MSLKFLLVVGTPPLPLLFPATPIVSIKFAVAGDYTCIPFMLKPQSLLMAVISGSGCGDLDKSEAGEVISEL